MDRRTAFVIALIGIGTVFVVLVGGVPLTSQDQSDPRTPTATPTPGESADPNREAEIDIAPGQVNTSQTLITMSIDVIVTIYDDSGSSEYDNIHYENVSLCLYEGDESIHHRGELGTISTRDTDEFAQRYTVNTTVSAPPKYIIVDHPDLRGDSPARRELLEWDDEREYYSVRHDDSVIRDAFDYPRASKPGQCG